MSTIEQFKSAAAYIAKQYNESKVWGKSEELKESFSPHEHRKDFHPHRSINWLKARRKEAKKYPCNSIHREEIPHLNAAIRYKQRLYFETLQYIPRWNWRMRHVG
jgi:hypothetical protein